MFFFRQIFRDRKKYLKELLVYGLENLRISLSLKQILKFNLESLKLYINLYIIFDPWQLITTIKTQLFCQSW